MSKRILLVEDDEPKQRAILRFLQEERLSEDVVVARSLTSAIDALCSQDFWFAIVDMSLPTYDLANDMSGGGTPQGFGGEDILRFISAESDQLFTVVVTQYDEFPSNESGSSRSLDELSESLRISLGDRFRGIIYYAGQHGEWKDDLKRVIRQAQEAKE